MGENEAWSGQRKRENPLQTQVLCRRRHCDCSLNQFPSLLGQKEESLLTTQHRALPSPFSPLLWEVAGKEDVVLFIYLSSFSIDQSLKALAKFLDIPPPPHSSSQRSSSPKNLPSLCPPLLFSFIFNFEMGFSIFPRLVWNPKTSGTLLLQDS